MTSLRNNHICLETTRTINLAMNIPEVLQNSPFEIWGKSVKLCLNKQTNRDYYFMYIYLKLSLQFF